MRHFQVVVVGGGHAGCEAAHAAWRCGASVALVTQKRAAIGAMSCNPSIGGVGKGHLVREIDALDGLMARAADAAAIHHRMLNMSKGPAVRGPRVQADRGHYARFIQEELAATAIAVIEGEAGAWRTEGGRIVGLVLTDGSTIACDALVLASGTFLGGVTHVGDVQSAAGRWHEAGSVQLAAQVREAFTTRRLKTGTPPRLDGRTIDWSRIARQASDDGIWTMSAMTEVRRLPQLHCGITRTNRRTHDLVRDAMARSPLRSGAISGEGPRYCPSLEEKVRRFGDRDGHQIFLEPEMLADNIVYPNGLSTSLPLDDQLSIVRSIAGLASVEITQPGYAVEYDAIDARQLDHCLAAELPGLFMAGQINGTTGYEEAAAQGLVAGVNAAAGSGRGAPLRIDRAQGYIGVLVDDLVLQGTNEPYRMLTSRAEHRLHLRADNAGTRLTEIGISAECVGSERQRHHRAYSEMLRGSSPGGADHLSARVGEERQADALYKPYLERTDPATRQGSLEVPQRMRFEEIAGMSSEMGERLALARPSTLAEAGRVRGITPAAITALYAAIRAHA